MAGGSSRETRRRALVRDALDRSAGFVSAQSLFVRLRASGHPVGLSTVYRTLRDLAARDLAEVALGPHGEHRYLARGTSGTRHLVCTGCARTIPVDSSRIEPLVVREAVRHGFTEVSLVIDLVGVCPECRGAGRAG